MSIVDIKGAKLFLVQHIISVYLSTVDQYGGGSAIPNHLYSRMCCTHVQWYPEGIYFVLCFC